MQEWLFAQDGLAIYAALFLLLMGGAIGLPIPEDIPIFLGGILAHQGQAKPSGVFLVCYSGILIGDILIYFIGRRFGTALFKKKWFARRFNQTQIDKVKFRLEKRSLLMIFLARHLFYFRTATFLTCGAVRMSFQKFIIADAGAALVSVPIVMGLGYLASEHYEAVLSGIKQFKILSCVLAAAAIIGYLVYRRRKTPTTKIENSGTPP